MALPPRYLHDVLDLPNDDHQTQMFEQYMCQLMPTFVATPWPGWGLFLSATRNASRDHAHGADAPDPNKQYLHIWRIRDYNTLPFIMERFDDDPVYRSLNRMVIKEVQGFAGALSYNPQSQHPGFMPPAGTRFYLRLELPMVKDPDLLSAHASFMTHSIYNDSSEIRKLGWSFVYGGYSQTGELARHVQIWATPHALPQPQAAVDALMGQPSFAEAVRADPDWETWEPIDYARQAHC